MREIHLWTDGSSHNNGEHKGIGANGFVLLFGEFEGVDLNTEYCDLTHTSYGSSGSINTTNQREEIKAVIDGLKSLKTNKYTIQVFSDSAYLINCMNQRWYANWRLNGWINSKKNPVENKDLWEELLNIIEDNMYIVKFNKVKGHSKIFYNEKADELAGIETTKLINEKRGA